MTGYTPPKTAMFKLILFQTAALAFQWTAQNSNTSANLRGLDVVSGKIVWASGTNGTFLLTNDGGVHWRAATVSGAESLDFRDVQAFDARTAYLLASGEGEKSRLYKTTDGGENWRLLFINRAAKGFLDALSFWDRRHGIMLGDPVDGHFVILTTADGGGIWRRQPGPEALAGEGAFAASGTCLVVRGRNDAWFATGGENGARVFRSEDGGKTWQAARVAMGGLKSAGIFSLAFTSEKHGIAVGGDYAKPAERRSTAAITEDGGKTWTVVEGGAGGYRSAVVYVPGNLTIAVGTSGADFRAMAAALGRHFRAETSTPWLRPEMRFGRLAPKVTFQSWNLNN